MLSLFHSRARAEHAIANASQDTASTKLGRIPIREYEAPEVWQPIQVPPLSAEVQRELKRGRDPVASFRKWVRRLEIVAAVEAVKARQAFALSKSAVAWLPSL
jgi:hypothetical protein